LNTKTRLLLFDAASRLTPLGALCAPAPPQGGSGTRGERKKTRSTKFLAEMSLARALALGLDPREGGWRAERRNLVARALRHAGASRRANMRSSSEAVAHQKMRSSFKPVAHAICGVLRRRAALQLDPCAQAGQRPVAQKSNLQASSWQVLVVDPGGAPAPPECSCCVHELAGTAPRPA
jgi:hypothetical protein